MTISDWIEHNGKRYHVSVGASKDTETTVCVEDGDSAMNLLSVPLPLWLALADKVRDMVERLIYEPHCT